jgi:hypothetical protein
MLKAANMDMKCCYTGHPVRQGILTDPGISIPACIYATLSPDQELALSLYPAYRRKHWKQRTFPVN